MTTEPHDYDDHQRETVMRFVEQFGLFLHQEGLPRMPARVFAYVIADDAEKYTASDLAEGLQVSPAAISGAVRILVQAGLLGKDRDPGSRVDHYRIYDDDVWTAIYEPRIAYLERSEGMLQKFIDEMDDERPGTKRTRETLEFFRFMQRKTSEFMTEWQQYRKDNNLGVRPG